MRNNSRHEVKELLPESTSRRSLPVNLNERDRALFKDELERTIPATKLLELKNVGISSDGLLFNGFKLMPESFAFPFLLEQWKRRSVAKFLIKNHLIKKRRRVTEHALWIVDNWSPGYFHWLADALSRLYVASTLLNDLLLLLPYQYQFLSFVRPSLQAFGVKRFEFIDKDEAVICDRLLLPTPTAPSGHYHEETIQGVRRVLLEAYGSKTAEDLNDKIYVSRSNALKRKIANEDEVKRLLEGTGFKVIEAENHSFEEQVKISSATRYLVSNHGAGFTNMLFMKNDGNVLELRHQRDNVNNCYFTLAAALKLNYFYQTCDSQHPNEDPHTANLIVDIEKLAANVEQMLAFKSARS